MTATCHTCKREFREGEAAWASEWHVFDTSAATASWRIETRYTCEDCEAPR